VFISSFKFLTVLIGDNSCTHALVKFVDEECTGVVPLKRIIGGKLHIPKETVTVLWNDRREYTAVFLYSGKQNFG